MAYGLAAQSGGALTLKSVVGQGTTVHLWFPPGQSPKTDAAPPPASPSQRSAKVLLVDDDPAVIGATAASLEDKGFTVTACGSADAALATLGTARPDILVTDLTMPDKDGAQLAWAARDVFPDLPVLVLTGFARPELQLPVAVEVLEKPYRPEDLASRIDALLTPSAALAGRLPSEPSKR